jgi:hypothetical protein
MNQLLSWPRFLHRTDAQVRHKTRQISLRTPSLHLIQHHMDSLPTRRQYI